MGRDHAELHGEPQDLRRGGTVRHAQGLRGVGRVGDHGVAAGLEERGAFRV